MSFYNEVDKELHKKSELRNLNIMKEDKQNDNKF